MSTMQDTIKALKAADKKIEKAVKLEESAVTIQKDAARLRDETRDELTKITQVKEDLVAAESNWRADHHRQCDELKNREKTLLAGQADLEHQTKARLDGIIVREDELNARAAELQNSEKLVNERMVFYTDVGAKYKAIAKFINETL